ncbi:hypothetical protein BTVI_82509 [Pitangus sulphuratus]|nr:hypothetical protein BTVI_82509 [Pitangus sulphuratus]
MGDRLEGRDEGTATSLAKRMVGYSFPDVEGLYSSRHSKQYGLGAAQCFYMTQATETAPYHSFAAAGTGFTLAKLEVELTSESCLTMSPSNVDGSGNKWPRFDCEDISKCMKLLKHYKAFDSGTITVEVY